MKRLVIGRLESSRWNGQGKWGKKNALASLKFKFETVPKFSKKNLPREHLWRTTEILQFPNWFGKILC